jgi:predicted transcriptional regulator
MKVRDVMTTDLITVDKDRNLKDVLHLMAQHNITKLPVVDSDGKLLGIVTDGKIADKLGQAHNKHIQTSTLRASSVMDKDCLLAHPDEALDVLLADVGKPGLTMVPVCQGEKLVGVVTKSDLLGLVESAAAVSSVMHREIHAVNPSDRLVHARRMILDNEIARLPVIENGMLEGIIAEHEIAGAFANAKSDSEGSHVAIREMSVGDYMIRKVVTAGGDISCADAAKMMRSEHVGALPIVSSEGKIEGIITRTDLIRTYAR